MATVAYASLPNSPTLSPAFGLVACKNIAVAAFEMAIAI
jgi:hypothetical protein